MTFLCFGVLIPMIGGAICYEFGGWIGVGCFVGGVIVGWINGILIALSPRE